MTTLSGNEGDSCELHDDFEYEGDKTREEAWSLEAGACDAERAMRVRVKLHDVEQEVSNLYDVLIAAGTLVSIAEKCHSEAPTESELHAKLRDVVENSTGIVNILTECMKHALTTGRTEPRTEKDQKPF